MLEDIEMRPGVVDGGLLLLEKPDVEFHPPLLLRLFSLLERL